jgi:hypothetical protein
MLSAAAAATPFTSIAMWALWRQIHSLYHHIVNNIIKITEKNKKRRSEYERADV